MNHLNLGGNHGINLNPNVNHDRTYQAHPFRLFKVRFVKKLVIDLLEAYVARTDNKLDDQALKIVKKNYFPKLCQEH